VTKRRDDKPSKPPALRARAEERLAERSGPGAPATSAKDAARLVHELEVHQIELEMQNEDLRRSRAEAEAALALYTELYDFAPVGYFTLGPLGSIRRANLGAAKLLGTERARLIDRRLGAFVASASLADLDAALTTALGGAGQGSCEVRLAAPRDETGESSWLQLTVSAAGDDELRAVAVDVTERRKAELLLRTSQKMEAIGRLAGGVAHDFNNLLTVVLGGVEAARVTIERGRSPHEELGLVTDAAQRAAALTRKLLAFGRRQMLRPEVVDANALTRGLTNLLHSLVGERIQLVLELAPDLAPIEVDPVQLEQAIVNLVVNAHDAMPDGGRLTVSTANVDVVAGHRSRGVKPGSYVVFTVTDTGTGMDGETIAHIFEPFFTTKARDRGTGLGLASVAGIVEQCGGEITVRSAPGTGTTFEIYFPRVVSAAAPAPPPRTLAPGGTETILFVDDELQLCRIAKRVLEAAGYTVLVAGSGGEALEVLAQHAGTIHLLITDVIMPGMTGPVLAGHVRAARPETKVLFLSGYPDDVLGTTGVLHKDLRFMSKPYTADALRLKIRDALD
jgi:two-component system cell cycle sensor histidine kinase/response regulator CckA